MADLNFTLKFTPDTGNLNAALADVQQYFNAHPIKLAFDTSQLASNFAKGISRSGGKTISSHIADIGNKYNEIWQSQMQNTIKGFTFDNNKLTQKLQGDFAEVQKAYNNIFNTKSGTPSQNQDYITHFDDALKTLAADLRLAKDEQKQFNQAQAEMAKSSKLDVRAEAFKSKFDTTYIEQAQDKITQLGLNADSVVGQKLVGHFQVLQTAIANAFPQGQFSGQAADLDAIDAAAKRFNETMKQAKVESQGAAQAERERAKAAKEAAAADMQIENNKTAAAEKYHTLTSFMEQYNEQIARSPYWTQQFNDALSELSEVQATGGKSSEEMQGDVAKLQATFLASGAAAETWGDKLRRAFTRNWDLALVRMAIQYIRRLAREMWSSVKEIDAALTQVRIVTGEDSVAMREFANDAVEAGKAIGSSAVNIIKSTETYARLGYSLKEATELATKTTIFSQIADIDIEDATSGMTSILKGFDKDAEDAEYITDVLTKVGQSYAVSASELATALQNTSAAMNQANTDFEKSVALIAAGNAAVQDASKVGNALKTTSLRIRGAKTDLEEAGLDTDGMAASVSKLREELRALSGVDIMIDDENFKDIYEIMLELSEVWDKLSDVSRANILELLAGKRNSQVVASIITNIDDMVGAYDAATNAAGTAAEANARYLDSIEGKTAQLKASFEGLATSAINSGDIKSLVSALTGVVNIINAVVKAVGLLPPILAALTAYKIITHAQQLTQVMTQVTSGLKAGVMTAQQAVGVMAQLSAKDREIIQVQLQHLLQTQQEDAAYAQNAISAANAKLSTEGLSEAEREEAQAALEAAQAALALAQAKAAQTQQTITATNMMRDSAQQSQGVAASAASIPALGWVGIAITAVTLLIGVFRKFQQQQEQAAADTAQALDDIADKNKNVEDTVGTIQELNEKLESNTLSQQEAYDARAEVLRLSGELQEAYGKEADLLNKNTDALKGYVDAVKISNAEDFMTKRGADFEKARREMTKRGTGMVSFGFAAALEGSGLLNLLSSNDSISLLSNKVTQASQEAIDASGADMSVMHGELHMENVTISEQIELWKQLRREVYEYSRTIDRTAAVGQAEYDAAKALLGSIDIRINELDTETYQNYKKNYEEGLQQLIIYDENYRAVYGDIIGLQERYTEAIKSGNEEQIQAAADAINTFITSADVFNAASEQYIQDDDVRNWLLNFITGLQDTANNNPVVIRTTIASDTTGAYSKAVGMAGSLSGFDTTTVINALNGNDFSAFSQQEQVALLAVKDAADQLGISYEALVQYMYDVAGAFRHVADAAEDTDIAKTWEDIDDIIADLSGDSLDDLADAYETVTERAADWNEAAEALSVVQDEALKGTDEYTEAMEALSDATGIPVEALEQDLSGAIAMVNGQEDMLIGSVNAMLSALFAISDAYIDPSNIIGGLQAIADSGDTAAAQLAQSILNTLSQIDGAHVEYTQTTTDNGWRGQFTSFNFKPKKFGGGGKKSGGGGGGGGGRDSIISEAYENLNDLNEHYLKLSKERISRLEKETVEYRVELGKQYAYAKRMAEAASAELARLRAAGYNESNEEYRKLLEQYEKYLSDMYDYAKDIWEAEKEARIKALEEQKDAEDKRWEEREKQLDYEIDRQQALIDLEKERQGVVGDIRSEYRELDKQLAAAKAQTEYLDEGVRDALFSDEDYKKLTSELKNIENQAESLYEVYQEKINGVTAENAYELEGITEEFERQYELLLKQYEVSKADLATARARRELENVMNERNVAMLVNGVWTWVADPEAVKGAVEAVYDAQADAEDALNELVDTQKLQALEQFKTDLEMRKEAEEAAHDNIIDGLDDQIDAIEKLKFNFDKFSMTLENGGKDVASAITEAVKAILDAKDNALAAIGAAKGSGGGGGGGNGGNKTTEEKIADIIKENNAKDLAGSWRRDPGYTPIKSGGSSGNFKLGATNKLMAFASGGVNDYTGIAHLDGTPARPEVVFNNADAAKLYSLVHNTDDLGAMLGNKIAGSLLTALLNPDSGAKSIINNSTNGGNVYIDGVQITGNDAKTLIDVFSRVVPTYSI